MNNFTCIVVGLAVVALVGWAAAVPDAQTTAGKKHRVVMQVTQDGSEHWESVLGNVENVREALGAAETQVEVVVHGKALGRLLAKDNQLAGRMEKLTGPRVKFVACQNTMKRKNVTKDQLVAFATTVDSGVAHVVRRQEEGWSYIRAAD